MKIKYLLSAGALVALSATAQTLQTTQKGDTTIIKVENPTKYLILPIEEERPEAQLQLYSGKATDTWMDVRLAVGKTDYCVPFALTQGKEAVVKIVGLPKDAVALKEMKLSDTFDTTNTDYYRPVYHHTPLYGWMNDANGLTYKDGEYHLYFQYNPYGSKWGNMHWGHSVSRDLVHWDHLDPAIARDPMGHIFSGSTIVDTRNSAGFGKNAIIAYYTSHSMRNGKQVQVQCMAYSKDNGRTFIKYKGNPVVTPFDGLENFRDPKIFWYEPTKSWYMIVSADKNMRFYQSKNLKKWTYVSQWGEGFGAQPNQFECPDFFPLAVDGDAANKKYVMIVNVNPGFVFGGSATEYFVGEFDGKEFKCDSKPTTVKWLDWGKDHYATVTFSNLGGRIVAVPWMSNWQYANATPIHQYRGANALRAYLRSILKDRYNVSEAADGRQGLEKARREVPKLIVCDVMMPVMDGLEFTRQLKEDIATSHIPVVLLTARSLPEQREKGYETGADSYLTKPFSGQVLLSRIDNLLRSRTLLRSLFSGDKAEAAEEERLCSQDKTFVTRLREIIQQHLADSDFSVERLGEEIGLSRVQLYRKVKVLTGKTPVELLRKARLMKARTMVTTTDRSIAEIAYATGFTSPSYFNKCFKDEFGVSPGGMRG